MAILLIWEAAFRVFQWKAFVFPAPSHIISSVVAWFRVDAGAGNLAIGIAVSLTRLLVGFVVSAALGVAVGLAMWRWQPLDRFLGPLFLGLQTLPSVCWAPLAILIYGFEESGILFVLVMGSAFAVALAFRDGLRTIPPIYQRAGLMLGARGWRLYYHVLLPASLPVFATSLRQGFSFAWRSLMGGEFVLLSVRHQGLGFLLDKGRHIGGVEDVLAIMIVMIGIGIAADRLVFGRVEGAIHRRFGLEVTR